MHSKFKRYPIDLDEAFGRRDLESFRNALENSANDSRPVSTFINRHFDQMKPGDGAFFQEAFRAGGEMYLDILARYVRNTAPGEDSCIPAIEYDATVFQEALDHVDEASIENHTIGNFIESVMARGTYDCITRSFTYIQKHNHSLPSGFPMWLFTYCCAEEAEISPMKHIQAILNAGIDITPYLDSIPPWFMENLYAEYDKNM